MPKKKAEPATQQTRPKKGESVEIPVPKRADVLAALQKAAQPRSAKRDGGPNK